jgi:hypothetical protein
MKISCSYSKSRFTLPLSLPSPTRRRGEICGNSKRISLPLDGGAGWGWEMDFFTPPGRERERFIFVVSQLIAQS